MEEIGAIFACCLPVPFPGLQVNTSTEAKTEKLPASLLTKAEATVTPTEKKKKAFLEKGVWLLPTTESISQQQTENATQLSDINRPFQHSYSLLQSWRK